MITRRNLVLGAATSLALLPTAKLSAAKNNDGSFSLVAGPADIPLYKPDGEKSALWTYNGSLPGPEIRVRKGERVKVNFTNRLEEPTSVHWHGIRIDNAMDGVSGLTQDPVQPGDSFEYDFVAPDAGTYWYHAHNKSWNQVGRGLYGPLIIEDDVPTFDSDHDITLVLDDWRLVGNGVLHGESFGSLMDWSHAGRLGNWITVNGTSLPRFTLNRGEAYRLRLINTANARIFELDPNRFSARLLAYDGQALEEPETLPYAPLLVGPSQRVDLLVTPTEEFSLEELSGDQPLAIASFSVRGETGNTGPPPRLTPNRIPEPDLTSAKRVRVVMEGGAMGGAVEISYLGKKLQGEDFRKTRQVWAFNGVANLPETPLLEATSGETVIIETVNKTRWMHAMHVHGHHFRIINRSGSQVDEGNPWRDTFVIGPEQTTEIAFVADNPGKWLYHCHMLEHAAAGMSTWFNVS
jgi:FtsP/CotA-like multicopper oxidase with cupredoxin domain